MSSEREAMRKILRENPELCDALAKALYEGRLTSIEDMPEEGEEFIFVCGPDHGGVEGSKQVKCGCGAKVWMSPSTQEAWKSRQAFPTRIVCPICVMRGVKEPKQ
jgi:hypothetical protein